MEAVELLKLAAANGIWAVLFVFLFLYQLKDGRTREQSYRKTIDTLGAGLSVVGDIKEDVAEIKSMMNSAVVSVIKLKKENASEFEG